MTLNPIEFFRVTDPGEVLDIENSEQRKYYIDFSSVRGGKIIEELKANIQDFYQDKPTCVLFTGHIGCGKSTELLRLQKELKEEGFHVVYFESTEDLEIVDVDISDILLAIARRISQNLDQITIKEPSKLKQLLQDVRRVLNIDIQGVIGKIPGFGDFGVKKENETYTLAFGIGEITAKAKDDSKLREKLNQYLGPRKTGLLKAINEELIEPAIAALKQQGKKGLVVIVDNLDRIDIRQKPWGRPQQEYLFIDQGETLAGLHCHLVYTMPLALKFSSEYGNLTQRFTEEPKVLPMVLIQLRNGNDCEEGMALLRQMVLARAFPDLEPNERLNEIPNVFENSETLDRLCRASGGHVRDLLKLLNSSIKKERKLPLSRQTLEKVIRDRRHEMVLPISDEEWELLRQVKQKKKVSGDQHYQTLIRSRLVFEYRDEDGPWFDINPILAEAKELQQ